MSFITIEEITELKSMRTSKVYLILKNYQKEYYFFLIFIFHFSDSTTTSHLFISFLYF